MIQNIDIILLSKQFRKYYYDLSFMIFYCRIGGFIFYFYPYYYDLYLKLSLKVLNFFLSNAEQVSI